MTDPDNSYRPRSPDFSNFAGSPPQHQQPEQTPYAFPQTSYDASPFFNPHVPRPSDSYGYQPSLISNFADMAPQTRSRTVLQQQQQQQHFYQPQPPASLPLPLPLPQEQQQQQLSPQPAPQRQSRQPRKPSGENAFLRPHTPPESHPPKMTEIESSPGPSIGIEVKTKFPVARIKRIMQADEDVGKVAQVTPIAVAKALEMFMISLVSKAAQQARERSSKRVTAVHLKEAIAKDEVLDFLADIISKVPDQPHKKDEDGSEPEEGRKRKGSGRRKKADYDVL